MEGGGRGGQGTVALPLRVPMISLYQNSKAVIIHFPTLPKVSIQIFSFRFKIELPTVQD